MLLLGRTSDMSPLLADWCSSCGMEPLDCCFAALHVGLSQTPEGQNSPAPMHRTISGRRGATLATHIILLQFSTSPPAGLTLLRAEANLQNLEREMASMASSRCSGLLSPSLAEVRCCSRPSSSLRLRPRWGLRQPRTLACVAPPDSAEPETVRFHQCSN